MLPLKPPHDVNRLDIEGGGGGGEVIAIFWTMNNPPGLQGLIVQKLRPRLKLKNKGQHHGDMVTDLGTVLFIDKALLV